MDDVLSRIVGYMEDAEKHSDISGKKKKRLVMNAIKDLVISTLDEVFYYEHIDAIVEPFIEIVVMLSKRGIQINQGLEKCCNII